MCMEIYLGSTNRLPTIEFDDENPGFYLTETSGDELPDGVRLTMGSKYYYELGSFMGCCCGFTYGDWSLGNKDESHELRVGDVKELMRYLSTHFDGNNLKIFCTSWGEFPEKYEEKDFNVNAVDENEFEFDEYIVLNIIP